MWWIVCEPEPVCNKRRRQQEQQLKLDQYRNVMLFLPSEKGYQFDDSDSSADFAVMAYSSETSKWIYLPKSTFTADFDYNLPVACNGMLHWLHETMDMNYTISRIVAIGPFKDNLYYYYIDFPLDLRRR